VKSWFIVLEFLSYCTILRKLLLDSFAEVGRRLAADTVSYRTGARLSLGPANRVRIYQYRRFALPPIAMASHSISAHHTAASPARYRNAQRSHGPNRKCQNALKSSLSAAQHLQHATLQSIAALAYRPQVEFGEFRHFLALLSN
jgi:hypothetical protein